jgi:hypothetical protein
VTCRKCHKEFAKGSDEHIIPEGLGGKTASDRVFCRECNEELGSLDRVLVEQLDFARNLLLIEGKKGSPVLRVTDDKGERLTLRPGGKPASVRPIERREVTDGVVHVEAQVPEHLMQQYKAKVEKLTGQPVDESQLVRTQTWPKINIQTMVGGPDGLRAVAKVAYDLVCDHCARNGLSVPLGTIEDYIFTGSKARELCLMETRPELYVPEDGFNNTVVVHFNSKQKNVTAVVTILGSLSYSVFLTDSYKGPESYSISMVNDPLDSSVPDKFDKTALAKDISTEYLLDRSYWYSKAPDDASVVQPMAALIRKVSTYNTRMALREVVSDAFRQAGVGDSDEAELTEEQLEKVIGYVAGRAAVLAARGRGTVRPNGNDH